VTSIPLNLAEFLFLNGGLFSELKNAENGLGYISFYVVIYAFIKWTAVRKYMVNSKEKITQNKENTEKNEIKDQENIPLLSNRVENENGEHLVEEEHLKRKNNNKFLFYLKAFLKALYDMIFVPPVFFGILGFFFSIFIFYF
jgi:predicted permease